MVLPSLQPADADVGIDHHDGLDVRRQTLEQAAHRARLAPVDAVVETAPSRLTQPQHGVVGRAVADQPDAIAVRRESVSMNSSSWSSRLYTEAMIAKGDAGTTRRASGGRIAARLMDRLPFWLLLGRCRRLQPCGAAHVQTQSEIDRIRVDDEIGDREHEDREADGLGVDHRQDDPAGEQRAHRKRRKHRPGSAELHAVAAARLPPRACSAGKPRVQLCANLALIGNDLTVLGHDRQWHTSIHSSERTREGRCATCFSSGASIASKLRSMRRITSCTTGSMGRILAGCSQAMSVPATFR